VHVEAKLAELGLELPEPMWLPEGVRPLWRQVKVIGTRAVIAGHGPRQLDGTPPAGGGKIGADLTPEAGYQAARSAALGVLGDLKREIGDLDRVVAWVRVFGLVNSAPGFVGQARVIDGFTELMVSLYGEDIAICPRAVAGAAELPFGSPVIIEGEVELAD
jgi:hypothetical protein